MELLYSKYTHSVEEETEEKDDVAAGEEKLDHDADKGIELLWHNTVH